MPARRTLAELFGVDLRSLALVRIGVGALGAVDLVQRAADLRAHYTDFGILPADLLALYSVQSHWTLHGLLSGSATAVAALFVLHGACYAALALGWHTRLAGLAAWLLLCSLQWRNPPLHHGGDVMLRLLLFFGLLLPWNARFSLDARAGRAPRFGSDLYASAGSLALLLQVCAVYWFAVLHRSGSEWWTGEALHYALHYEIFAKPAAARLLEHAWLLPPLTVFTAWMEGIGPLLAFSPVWRGPLRSFVAFAFVGFHLGIHVLFSLGLFPWVFSVAWLAFLPGWLWDRLPHALRPPPPEPPAPGSPRFFGLHPLGQALAAFLIAYAYLCNWNTLTDRFETRRLADDWTEPARWLFIDQRWGLFAPNPPHQDGWYVERGELASGERVNVLDPSRPSDFAKPSDVSASLGLRWREFFYVLDWNREDPRYGHYGSWRCREWNERHVSDERLVRLYLYFVREPTGPAGPERGRTETLLAHECERGGAVSGAAPSGGATSD